MNGVPPEVESSGPRMTGQTATCPARGIHRESGPAIRMAEVFRSHLEWTGAAHGATRDVNSFSRDLEAVVRAGHPRRPVGGTRLQGRPEPARSRAAVRGVAVLVSGARLPGPGGARRGRRAGLLGRRRGPAGARRTAASGCRSSRCGRASSSTPAPTSPWRGTSSRRLTSRCFVANSVTSRVTIEPTFQNPVTTRDQAVGCGRYVQGVPGPA